MTTSEQIQNQYKKLSKSQQKVANYIFSNPEQAAMQTMAEIAVTSGVSETTVIRLSRILGYGGFSAMQKQMQADLLQSSKTASFPATPVQNAYQGILNQELELLQAMRDGGVDYIQLQRAAEKIAGADYVMVLGYYGEHTAAYQLYLLLDALRANVYYYRSNNMGMRQLTQLNEKSVVISITFPPYCPGTLELVEQTKKQGSYMLAITDSPLSPCGQLADEVVTLQVGRESETQLNCMTTVNVYNQMLMAAVKDQIGEEALRVIRTGQHGLVQPKILP